ncbi:transcription antitermination factor NusB [Olsenella sp. HMSC062G07]|uniref:transcription antitermination factor NusB n=1 Tax=Olsenella sp. HMSC062G07 TaxID=1739330 RepID=UPI0008A3F3FB|nr:hypothetical protein HMPREF2826_06500 [Olsenella sp. HMSC062G07]
MSETCFRGRTLARSQAVQLLYQAEFSRRSVRDVLSCSYVVSGAVPGDYVIARVRPGRPNVLEDPDDGKVWVWSEFAGSRTDGEAAGDFVRVRLRAVGDQGLLAVRAHGFKLLVWDDAREGYVCALSRREEPLAFDMGPAGCFVADGHGGSYEVVEASGIVDDYARELACGCDALRVPLDHILDETSPNWGVSRMPSLDRNLLRLALFEMLAVDAVDVSVAIDEGVELAKAYGTDDSSRFVNGVLGRVADRIEQGDDVIGQARLAVERAMAEQAACEGGTSDGDGADERPAAATPAEGARTALAAPHDGEALA